MSNVSQTFETCDYTVVGMTCARCLISVREEVSQVRAAVEEAGYELASTI